MSAAVPAPAAVVLLSGGLDSATVLALAKAQDRRLFALSFDYGQRQRVELAAARRLAAAAGCLDHQVVQIDARLFGGSALTDPDIAVPAAGATPAGQIPCTYVPARNTLFLSYALAWAETVGATEIHLGINAIDYSGYPDCRPEFLAAFEAMAQLATRAAVQEGRKVRLVAPLLALSKAQIVQLGTRLGVQYAATHSCYSPTDSLACGRCDACTLRREGFAAAGVVDPTAYVRHPIS